MYQKKTVAKLQCSLCKTESDWEDEPREQPNGKYAVGESQKGWVRMDFSAQPVGRKMVVAKLGPNDSSGIVCPGCFESVRGLFESLRKREEDSE